LPEGRILIHNLPAQEKGWRVLIGSELAVIAWASLGFLLGSVPFSVLLGRALARVDIRKQPDGNPGAANAWRAGGWRVGVPAILLDYLKGLVPVGLAVALSSVSGPGLVLVALAPVFGHAFSPFLRFRGGKAVAASLGVWTALCLLGDPVNLLALALAFLVIHLLQSTNAWTVVLAMLGFLVYLLIRRADAVTITICVLNLLVLAWKHRRDLRQVVRFRPFLSGRAH